MPEIKLIRLTSEHKIKPFDCGDDDLNDFLLNSAKNYSEQLFAVTNILETETETVAFFSLFNDKVALQDFEGTTAWNRFRKKYPNAKRIQSYPAMKIGRLAVSEKYKGNGIGRDIIGYLKQQFISDNRTGCRYITVDAYTDSLEFYQKCDFNFLTPKDNDDETRLMYFDLKNIT